MLVLTRRAAVPGAIAISTVTAPADASVVAVSVVAAATVAEPPIVVVNRWEAQEGF